MALSFSFGEWQQAAAIAVVLLINAAIGYGTERGAVDGGVAGAWRPQRTGAQGRPVRGRERRRVGAGDVVLLEAGDVVPADLRCACSAALGVDESALTGESMPVGKTVEPDDPEAAALHERAPMLFTGTHVVRGSGEGIVVRTGLAAGRGSRTAAERPRISERAGASAGGIR